MSDETTSWGEETSPLEDWRVPEVEEDRPSGFHPLQAGYLVAGLLALGAALMWLLMDQGVLEVSDGSVAWSVVLIAAGGIGLIASLGRAVRRR